MNSQADLHRAWEAYQQAAAKYVAMQKADTPQPELFEQAMLVNRLQREFAGAYGRSSGPKQGLRLVGGTDAPC